MEEDPAPNMEEEDDEDELEDDEGVFDWLQEEQEVFVSRERPAERSGHIAVTDRGCMFVWGGYKVSIYSYKACHTHISLKMFVLVTEIFISSLSFCQNADTDAAVFTDLYLPKNEVWIYNMEMGRW